MALTGGDNSMIIHKSFETETRAHGDRRMRFLISTGGVDRDGDKLDPRGWVLDAYRRNPVIQFCHDYKSLPIAKCVEIRATRTGLEAVAEFPPRGLHEFADVVFDMLRGGFLNATSVGFRPIEFEESRYRKGKNFLKQELTEFSVMPIPSNPDALIQRSPEGQRWTKALLSWAAGHDGTDHPSPKGEESMKQTRDNEIVLRIIDAYAPPPHLVAHAVLGRAKIDRYNELHAQDEAARQAKHDAWLIAKGFKEERS
jgi:HK97 family phage prohead protease